MIKINSFDARCDAVFIRLKILYWDFIRDPSVAPDCNVATRKTPVRN